MNLAGLRQRLDQITDEHSRSPVPYAETVPGVQVGLVIMGIALTLPLLYTGGELARQLGFVRAVEAVLWGALILSVMSVPAAIVGVKTRRTSYLIVEHVFGDVGAKAINLAFGIALLGWYSVTAELFGRTLFLAANDFIGPTLPEWAFTVLSSLLVIVTTLFGFKAIDRLALFAVPLLVLFLVYVAYLALTRNSLDALLAIEGTGGDFDTAVSAVVGSSIVGVVLIPDLTRYIRTVGGCFTASVLGNGGGSIVAMVLAMVPALLVGMLDPMAYMIALGLAAVAFIVLVFATWTTNVVNLWSTGLVTATAVRQTPYWQIVIALGALGTVIAVVGIADHLIDALVILGLIVPPVAGVYLADFFVLRRQDYEQPHPRGAGPVNWPAMIASLGGGAVASGYHFSGFELSGVSAFDSLTIAGVLYLALDWLWARLGARTRREAL